MRSYLRHLLVATTLFTFAIFLLPASSALSKGATTAARGISSDYSTLGIRFLLANFLQADEGFTDLSVTKTGPDTVEAGSNITYTITVVNFGPDAAPSATLDDPLPAGTTFVSVTPPANTGWTCSDPGVGASGNVTCTNASLPVTSGDTFTLVVNVPSNTPPGTFITNQANVTTATLDINDENNSSTAATSVVASGGGGGGGNVDVGVSKSVDAAQAIAGSNITYTITVTEAGATASNVTLGDSLPGDMTFVSLNAPMGWSCTTPQVGAGGPIICTTPFLAPTNGVTFTLVGNIPPGTPTDTTYDNTAMVTTTSTDINSENDSSHALTTVIDCQSSQVVVTTADGGDGSLRQAIVNACAGGTLTFDSTVFNPAGGPYTITLTSGELLINKGLTITGPGANVVAVSGNNASRVFNISAGASTVSLSGLTIRDGKPSGGSTGGGGILINNGAGAGAVNLTSLVVTNNDASLAGNPLGGGIDNEGGTVTIDRSSIINNVATVSGGGIQHQGFGSMVITNSTIAGNTAGATGTGGGIQSSLPLTLTSDTIFGNSAQTGGNVSRSGDTITFGNTIIAGGILLGSGGTSPDVNGTGFNSADYNLIQDTTGATITGTTTHNITGVSPNLLPLGNYGGPTPTLLPQPGSPVINAGNPAIASGTDQRGFPRVVGGQADIGSVEANYSVLATAGTPQSAPINTAFATNLQATVLESGNRVGGVQVTFVAPASGPSGTFAGGTTSATVTANSNGDAVAPTFTANGTAGGPYSVTASLSGGAPFATFSLTNLKGQAQVTLSNLVQTYDGTPKSVTVTTNPPGLNVVVTYDGSTTPPTNAGSYAVVATVNDPNYDGQATGTLVINKANQTITFGPLADKTFGDPDFTVSATASSGLTVSFTASGQCTVSGTTVHITGAGSCTITASQAGDSNYNAATPVSQTFTIAKAATTTSVSSSANPSDVGQNVTFTATVTSTAGTPTGTVQFQIDGANAGSPVTLSGGVATFSTSSLSAGTHTVTANYSGDGNFNASTGTLSGGQVVRAQPSLSISDASVTEGNSGTASATFTVTLSAASNLTVSVNFATADGTATVANNDYQAASGTVTFSPGQTTQTITVTVNGDTVAENNETFFVNLTNAQNAALSDNQGVGTIVSDDAPVIQLSSATYSVAENGLHATITVNRLGDTSNAATVDYATSDTSGLNNCSQVTGIASQRCDYATVVGTLRFAAGESSKNILIPIVNDSYLDGNEQFTITLTNATGQALGSNTTAIVTINDDDLANGANPISDDAFFVRQLYIDFLGREPEPAGLQAWLDVLHNTNGQCNNTPTNCDRIAVALGFVRSPEFIQRGYFAFRFYAAALGRNPRYSEFIPDMARLSGFLNSSDLEANKVAFVNEFSNRQEFRNLYDPTIGDPTSYVDKLLQTAGLPNHPMRSSWISQLTNGQLTRQQVLRQFIESTEVDTKFYNQAFIVMNYFGFLRRDPDAAYQTWIDTFNRTNDYRVIVNGFINSPEYPQRFGP